MMERGLRGKVAALGAAVVLCAGGSLLGSSPQDTYSAKSCLRICEI